MFGLSIQNVTSTCIKIFLGVVCGIGPVCDYSYIFRLSYRRKFICQLAHMCQTHLCYKIEVILIDNYDLWLMLLKHGFEASNWLGKRSIEYSDGDTGGTKSSRSIESSQRGIGLHLPKL